MGGYAGNLDASTLPRPRTPLFSNAAAAIDRLELSVGAEARFPHKAPRFDDDIVSGRVSLAEWSAFAAVGWRF